MDNVLNGVVPVGEIVKGSLQTVYGQDGKSAYELAVKNGYEGTEEEWLASLKGEQGEKGDSGGVGVATTYGGEIFNDYEGNLATGLYSHASGFQTRASQRSQFVCGESNNTHSETLFEVGNGEPSRLVRVEESEIGSIYLEYLELGDCYAYDSYNAPEWLPATYDNLTSLKRLSPYSYNDVLSKMQDPAVYIRTKQIISNAFEVYKDGHAEVQNMGNTDNSVATKQYVDSVAKGGGSGGTGADGYSPIATVEETENGATITITDKNGTTTATVKNGKDGERGSSGVYVGSGDMPTDCNVQIDPEGEALDLSNYATKEYVNGIVGGLETLLGGI